MALADIPVYGAFLERRRQIEGEPLAQLQQMGALQQVLAGQQKMAREAALQKALAEAGGDPDKMIAALTQSTDPAHAIPLAKLLQERKLLAGLNTEALLDNPQAALTAQAVNPHIGPELERLRKVRDARALADTMRSKPAIPPDPQEVAQGADQGTPVPETVSAQQGVFDTLTQSTNASIAQSAKNLKAQIEALKNPNPQQVAYFEKAHSDLAGRQAVFEQADKARADADKRSLERQKELKQFAADLRDPHAEFTNITPDPLRPGQFLGMRKGSTVLEPMQIKGREAVAATAADVTGEEFLKTLDKQTQTTVKAIAEGRQAVPSGFALKSAYWQNLMTLVGQYDPTYNAARPQVWKDFTSGRTAEQMKSLRMSIYHIGTFKELSDALENKDVRAFNAVKNRLASEIGDPRLNNVQMSSQAVGEELMRVFRQVNASEHEARMFMERLGPANSPAQIAGAAKTAVELLKGRMDAIDEQWKAAMGPNKSFPIMSEQTKATLQKLGVPLVGEKAAPSSGKQRIRLDAQGNIVQ